MHRFLILLLFALPAQAADIYFAQTAAGGNTGASCANARALSTHASGDDVAGNTIHLCGTITGTANSTGFQFLGSGASGNPVTLNLEAGALLTAPYWAAAISSNGKSNLKIDGLDKTTVKIQNTAAGSALANVNVQTFGVSIQGGGSNIEVTRVNGNNIYVHSGTASDGETTAIINVDSGAYSNISVHDNVGNYAKKCIFAGYGTLNTFTAFNNTCTNQVWGVALLDNNTGSTASNVTIHDNDISGFDTWFDSGFSFHYDGIFLATTNPSTSIAGYQVYNNYLHSSMDGNGTAYIYLSGSSGGLRSNGFVYNNVIDAARSTDGHGTGSGDGNITVGFDSFAGVYGNTIISCQDRPGVLIRDTGAGVSGLRNNIIEGSSSTCNPFVAVQYKNPPVTNGTVGNNLYFNLNAARFFESGDGTNFYTSLSSWQSFCSCDASSAIGNPSLTGAYVPTGSAAINTGVNLTSIGVAALNADKSGVARPATGPWTIGALNASGTPPAPQLTMSPSSAAFGSVVVGSASSPITITVSSTGTGSATLGSPVATFSDPQFSSTGGTCTTNETLAVGSSCTVTIQFLPTSAGSKTATMVVGANTTASIGLTGAGSSTSQPAFPWAQGGGGATPGGRGKPVMLVTNTNDSGTGSLRACLTTGNVNCVPTVGGTVVLQSGIVISNPFVTFYGQAAPGGGLQVTNNGTLDDDFIRVCTHDVILEDFRSRGQQPYDSSTNQFAILISLGNSCPTNVSNVIADHISIAYALFDSAGTWSTTNTVKNETFSYNILAEPTYRVNHSSGVNTGSGTSSANADTQTDIDFVKNWFHSSGHRNPITRSQNSRLVNNIVYNSNYYDMKGGAIKDFINNYIKQGPYGPGLVNEIQTWSTPDSSTSDHAPSLYILGNAANSNSFNGAANQWTGTLTGITTTADNSDTVSSPIPTTFQRTTPQAVAGVAITADTAASIALANGTLLPAPLTSNNIPGAGASYKLNDTTCQGGFVTARDSLDARYLTEFLNGTGISANLQDPGTLPTLAAGTPCTTTQNDGIPDAWKTANGLSTSDATLFSKVAPNGWTYLESYMWNIPLGTSTTSMSAAPTSFNFGSVTQNTTSTGKVFTISNTGTTSITLSNPVTSFSGTNAADFSIAQTGDTCVLGLVLAPGATCTKTVFAKPSIVGAESASMTVSATTASVAIALSVTGTAAAAPSILISPRPLNFGSVNQGATSGTVTATVTNNGNVSLTLSTPLFTIAGGTNPADFTKTGGTCTNGQTLAVNATCTITLTATPTTTNLETANLTASSTVTTNTVAMQVQGVAVAIPGIGLTPTTVTFATTVVGQPSATQTVTVTSTGTANLVLTAITFTGTNAANFAQTGGTCTNTSSLGPGSACTIIMTMTPSAPGTRSATLNVTGNASGAVPLTGSGIAATVSLTASPSPLAFGAVAQGTTSAAQTVTITNTGNSPTTLSTPYFTLTGTNAGDFANAGTGTCANGGTLAAAGICTVKLTFHPTLAAAESAILTVTDGTHPVTDNLTGTGTAPAIGVTPSGGVAFGAVLVGSTSSQQTVTVTSSGNTPLVLNTPYFTISGTNPGDFTNLGTGTCVNGQSLNTGASCTIILTFTPSGAGSRTATLNASGNASGSIPLAGTGTAIVVTLSASPSPVNFGTVQQSTSSAVNTVTVTNTGNSPATLSTPYFTITTGNASDFANNGTGTCANGGTLAAGASCTINLVFTPSTTSAETTTLTINAAGGVSTTDTLNGTGTAPTSPSLSITPPINFASTNVGATSAGLTVTVTNSGTAAETLANPLFTLTGTNPGDFARSGGTCANSGTIAISASCTIILTFSPSGAGTRTATLNILGTVNQSAPVTGTGVAVSPNFVLTPNPRDFGSVTQGTASSPFTITVTNNGTGSGTLGSPYFTLTGTNAADWAVTGGTCANGAVIAVNGTCTSILSFTPSTQAAETATLTVSSGTATLTGTGTAPAVPAISITPTTIAFGNQNVASTSGGLTVTITNSGTASLVLSNPFFTLTGANPGDFARSGGTCTSGSSISVAANCTIILTFTPAAAGSRTAILGISGSSTSKTAPITGTGVATTSLLTVLPNPVEFGTVTQGSPSALQVVTVTNTGTNTLTFANPALTVTGANATDFQIVASTCNALQTGLLTVTAAGANYNYSFTSAYGLPSASFTIPRTPTPTSSSTLGFQITPTNLLINGSPSADFAIFYTAAGGGASGLFQNGSTADLNLSGPQLYTGAVNTPTMSIFTNQVLNAFSGAPAPLTPSMSCTVSIAFTPSTTAGETATLGVFTTAVSGSTVLLGTGQAISPPPAPAPFIISTVLPPGTLACSGLIFKTCPSYPLTVKGSFKPTSVITLDGAALPTTCSATACSATIPAATVKL